MTSTPPAENPTEITQRKALPTFLVVSIAALIAVAFLSVAVLFFDSIEAQGTRVFLTFLIFATFVGLTAFDSWLGTKRSWYAPMAAVSNIYFLSATLLVAWFIQPGYAFNIFFPVIAVIISIIVILRAALLLSLLAFRGVDRFAAGGLEAASGMATAILVSAAAALYSGYIAVTSAFARQVNGWEGWSLYLKVSTALLILSGVALSITLLLRWYAGSDMRATRRLQNEANREQTQAQPPHPFLPGGQPFPTPPNPQAAHSQMPPAQPPAGQLPWPRLPDGSPYPAGADGQPDFPYGNSLAAQMNSGTGRS